MITKLLKVTCTIQTVRYILSVNDRDVGVISYQNIKSTFSDLLEKSDCDYNFEANCGGWFNDDWRRSEDYAFTERKMLRSVLAKI